MAVLSDYISYYNKYRTHLGINKDSPEGRESQLAGKIEKIPAVRRTNFHVGYSFGYGQQTFFVIMLFSVLIFVYNMIKIMVK